MSTTWINRGHFYAPHVSPVLVDCNFVVDPTNGNGLGINSLKGQGVSNVFMHTSSTPGKGPNGVLNPNPANGIIMVQLADNFMRYFGGFSGFVSPVATSTKIDNSALTVGNPYVITIVGNSSLADWISIGLRPGIVPAVGVSFVATAIGVSGEANTSTSRVMIPGASGIDSIEVIGDANKTINPIPVGGSPNVGGWIYLQCLGSSAALTMNSYTPAGVITNGTPDTFAGTPAVLTGSVALSKAPAAPAAGSVLGLSFYLSQSSVLVSGE